MPHSCYNVWRTKQAAEQLFFSGLLGRCKDAPHIVQTRKCLNNGAKQKWRFLLCELKKPWKDFFSLLITSPSAAYRCIPAAIIACIPAGRHNAALSGAPETTRTSDLPLRRRLLYPTELPGHIARAGVILAQRSRGVMHGKPAGRLPLRGNGGAEEDRTPDLRIANATLSQLSYRPI